MAAEELLLACNMDLFPLETLDEIPGLSSEETLAALPSCSDPSILSLFEEVPTVETKGLDEDSEAMLLTALTEILDNVDDENLSPFDTLPDSDLLSNQKGREHSPLRRLLCLSRSPQEKETFFSTRPSSAGKSLFRTQGESLQRSDGEEEEDGSFTLSSDSRGSSPDSDLLGWDGLTLPLPLTFEQEGEDGLSVSLGDLVRHMHPYCIPVYVENEDGEHMLPEGGILLEVVDQGENGEAILAVPNVTLSAPELPAENEGKVSGEAEEESSDSSEHIVVDDEDDAPIKKNNGIAATTTPLPDLDVKDDFVIKRQKENKIRNPSRRKKKKKCKEVHQPLLEEGRVLRSGTVRKTVQESQKKPERGSVKKEKKQKVLNVPRTSTLNPEETKPRETQIENTTTAQRSEMNEKVAAPLSPQQDTVLSSPSSERGQPTCSTSPMSSQRPCETPKQPITAPVEVESSPIATSVPLSLVPSESPAAAPSSVIPEIQPPVSVSQPFPEPKPKSLSLEEYRRLRQLKKPAPMEQQEKNSIKWPTLPELPKELPPIPCLPDPSPKDPRRLSAQVTKKEVEEVKPAWQPRGPGAPPTPEALLVPPAYMIASSSKVASAAPVPKPQQTPNPSKLPEQPSTPSSNSQKNLALLSHTTAKPTVPCVPQSCVSSGSSKPSNHLTCSADGKHPSVLGRKAENNELQQSQPVSPKHTKVSTTDVTKSTTGSGSSLSVLQNSTVVSQKLPEVTASTSFNKPVTCDIKSSRPTASSVKPSPAAALHLDSCSPTTQAAVLETKDKSTTQRAKSATQELIETFTSEIGIEAADLTSLLEQFEETQVKEEQYVPEVYGRAAAVGNSRSELVPEKTLVERVKANDLLTSAALTPPATPPHQMWKPLSTTSLLGKNKSAETSKLNPSKIIQIEAQPLPLVRSRGKPAPPTVAAASVASDLACLDHDYCLPSKGASTGEPGKRWNVKQQSLITIKPIKQDPPATRQTPRVAVTPSNQFATNLVVSTKTQNPSHTDPSEKRTLDKLKECSVLETPDASPVRQVSESSFKARSPRRRPLERSYRQHAASRTPSPRCSPKKRTRGRSRKRKCHRSPSRLSSCSDSCSSRSRSRSFSPARKRYRSRNSGSSSSSSSRSSSRSSPSLSRSPPRRRRYSYSSSRSGSGSWSRSRSRSQSPRSQWSRSRRLYSPTYRSSYHNDTKRNMDDLKRRKEKAIEERRVVYVGRIRGTMTQKELKERFSLFGEIEECTLHFRDHGDNYGFVTYYDTKDAFTAIENGNKLRKPDELPFDLCFGGRRQFCQTGYADLDSNREYDPLPTKGAFHALDFDTLLKQAQQNLKR